MTYFVLEDPDLGRETAFCQCFFESKDGVGVKYTRSLAESSSPPLSRPGTGTASVQEGAES